VNFATCPDDETHLKALRRPVQPGQKLILTCPTCGKNFMLSDRGGVVEVGPTES
jgi:hypothetical protein